MDGSTKATAVAGAAAQGTQSSGKNPLEKAKGAASTAGDAAKDPKGAGTAGTLTAAPNVTGAVVGGVGTADAIEGHVKDSPSAAVAEAAGVPTTRGSSTSAKGAVADATGSAESAPDRAAREATGAAVGTAANTAPGAKVLDAREAVTEAEHQKTLKEGDSNTLKTSASDAKRKADDVTGAAETGGGTGKVEE